MPYGTAEDAKDLFDKLLRLGKQTTLTMDAPKTNPIHHHLRKLAFLIKFPLFMRDFADAINLIFYGFETVINHTNPSQLIKLNGSCFRSLF